MIPVISFHPQTLTRVLVGEGGDARGSEFNVISSIEFQSAQSKEPWQAGLVRRVGKARQASRGKAPKVL